MLSNKDIILARRRTSNLRTNSRISQLVLGVAGCAILYSAFIQPEGRDRLGHWLMAGGLGLTALILSTWVYSVGQTTADNAELLQEINHQLHKQNTDTSAEG